MVCKIMIVGVFSPVINWCGGAEWVAVNIINALKQSGHQVIILSDKPLILDKFRNVFGKKIYVDRQIIFPFRLFSSTNYHNIYTDAIRIQLLKSKCDVVIDTFSNAVLPATTISYIHHPLLTKVEKGLPHGRNKFFFYPYRTYLKSNGRDISKKLVFANSKFTAEAIKAEIGIDPIVLYPSVSNEILRNNKTDLNNERDVNVITVSRITSQKRLYFVPEIAKLTNKHIKFTIVGLLDSLETLTSLNRLARELGVSDRVKVLTNVTRENLRSMLLNSRAYLHTTVNEHFGISIVEAMALGCIPVVHNSGGPKEFVPSNQRYNTPKEAAEIVERVVSNWSPIQARKVSDSADCFSENNFCKQFMNAFRSKYN